MLSRYTLWGRRAGFRRDSERRAGGYVDRYSKKLFFVLILIVILNIMDAAFTMVVLANHGVEVNPIVKSAIDAYGDNFWIWKFIIVSACVVILCLHSKFRRVNVMILGVCSTYIILIIYQILLIAYRMPAQ